MKNKNPNSEKFYRDLSALVTYDAATGKLFWKRRDNARSTWNTRFAGKECGGVNNEGFRGLSMVGDEGVKYWVPSHRLIWLIVYGHLPNGEIKHLDENRSNNLISNLIECSHSELAHKYRKLNPSKAVKVRGVYFNESKRKHYAKIQVNKKAYSLGYYNTAEEAEAAVIKFRKENNLI